MSRRGDLIEEGLVILARDHGLNHEEALAKMAEDVGEPVEELRAAMNTYGFLWPRKD